METTQRRRPEILRWVLISVLALCCSVACCMEVQTDPIFRREPSISRARLKQPADMSVLMLGNSLIAWRDTDVMLERLAASRPGGPTLRVGRIAPPGWTLFKHGQASSEDSWSSLISDHRRVFTYWRSTPRWDVVVLQEQSTQGALCDDAEVKSWTGWGASTLQTGVLNRHGRTILLQTWGYRRGQPPTARDWELPAGRDFKTMARNLTRCYAALAATLDAHSQQNLKDGYSSWANPVQIAPVGQAFELVWDAVSAAGEDPQSAGSRFMGLYDDNNHPSVAGAYLSAAVLLVTITGEPCGDATWVPEGLDKQEAARLRALADGMLGAQIKPLGPRFEGSK